MGKRPDAGDETVAIHRLVILGEARAARLSWLNRRQHGLDDVQFANWAGDVLPPQVPLGQSVVTFPFQLRARMAFDAKPLSAVCGLVDEVLLGFYERALRERGGGGSRVTERWGSGILSPMAPEWRGGR